MSDVSHSESSDLSDESCDEMLTSELIKQLAELKNRLVFLLYFSL